MTRLITLIRREFWEHRSLLRAPLAVAAILILSAGLGTFSIGSHVHLSMQMDADGREFLDSLTPEKRANIFGILTGGLLVPQLIVMLIIVSIYLLDCLYAERKDRSILFWKSLPVSDGETVASKFLVATLVVPLFVYAVSVVTSIVCYALLALHLSATPFAGVAEWNTPVWLRVQAVMFADIVVAALWYAPVAAALLLASAWARRSVYLWVTLTPILVMFAERQTFGTRYVADFLGYRLGGFFRALREQGQHVMPGLKRVYEHLDGTSLLANPDLWLGIVAAIALLWLTARIRRYRDET
jgi:ABC-2 type transport system permease protein